LDVYRTDSVPERARAAGAAWKERLQARLARSSRVRDVRGLGLLIGIELGEPDGSSGGSGLGGRVAQRLLTEGVLVLPAEPLGNVVELPPPAYPLADRVDHAVETLARAIEALG